jgi:hypothetical protein
MDMIMNRCDVSWFIAMVLAGVGFVLGVTLVSGQARQPSPSGALAAGANPSQAMPGPSYVLTTFDGNVQQKDVNIALSNSGQDVSFATGTIVGRVVCRGGSPPIADALVAINGTSIGTTSSADGTFTLTNVPAGIYWRVSAVGTSSDYGYYVYRVCEFCDVVNVLVGEGATKDVDRLYLYCPP